MADSKISALTAYTTPLSADLLPIVDTANTTTKSIAWSALLTALASAVQVFTNKTFDTAGTGNVFKINGTGVSAVVGTGSAVLSAAPTLTGVAIIPQILCADNAVAAVSNAATVTRSNRNNVVTNSSAATLTITLSTTSATGGDMLVVQIVDFSAVAQTITWVNTENGTTTVPTTSNGSTTLPLTVGFKWNPLTSKWRCVASA